MKDNYIRLRLTEEEKQLIKAAADEKHMTMTNYIVQLVIADQKKGPI